MNYTEMKKMSNIGCKMIIRDHGSRSNIVGKLYV